MITSLLNSFVQLRRIAAHVTALVGLAGLTAFSSAQAVVTSLAPNAVVPGDTFSIEVVGYNTSSPSNDIYLIYPLLTPTFGTTTSYTNDALNGQTLTVTSTESTAGGITSDFFSFSVPTNFVPAGTVDNGGNTLNAIQFSVGNYLGGSNPVDLSTAATGFNATNAVVFKFNGVTVGSSALATVTSSNGNEAYSSFGQTTSGGDISGNQITDLSLTITYAAVPEPSTCATVLLGAAGLCWLTVARRRARA